MVVVGAIALAVYLRTLAPTITWAHHGADGGDLIAAVVTGGIPHPTGYPTYLLFGRLFLFIPWGDAARRLNLMSAVFATLAVSLLYRIVLRTFRLSRGRPVNLKARLIAGASALAFAFSPLLWSQAVITEVYTLNAFFVALTIDLVLWWVEQGDHRLLAAAALLFGLALGNHLTLVLLAPAILLGLWWHRDRLLAADAWRVAVLPLLFVLGLSVYVALPWRAGQEPPVNWGNPRTMDGFLWLVSGKLYQRYVFSLPLRYLPARLSAWTTVVIQQFGWWGGLVGLFGLRSLWQEERRIAIFLGAVFFSYSVYAGGYDTTDSQVYLIPALMACAVWLSWGLALLIDELERWIAPFDYRSVRAPAVCLVLVIPFASLIGNFRSMDLSADREARHYSLNVLEAVEPEAIIISQTDAHTFALWYMRYAERWRTDVAVLDGALLHHPWYRHTAAVTHPRLGLSEPSIVMGGDGSDMSSFSLTVFIEEHLDRCPVYLTDPDAVMWGRFTLSERGPVYRVIR